MERGASFAVVVAGWLCAGPVPASDGAAGILRVWRADGRGVCAHGASAGRATDAARNGGTGIRGGVAGVFSITGVERNLAGTILSAGLEAVVGHGGDGGGLGLAAGAVAVGSPLGMEFRSNHAGLHRRPGRVAGGPSFSRQPFLAVARVVALGGRRAGIGRGGWIAGHHRPMVEEAPREHSSAAAMDAAGVEGGGLGCAVCGEFLFWPIDRAAAESIRQRALDVGGHPRRGTGTAVEPRFIAPEKAGRRHGETGR